VWFGERGEGGLGRREVFIGKRRASSEPSSHLKSSNPANNGALPSTHKQETWDESANPLGKAGAGALCRKFLFGELEATNITENNAHCSPLAAMVPSQTWSHGKGEGRDDGRLRVGPTLRMVLL